MKRLQLLRDAGDDFERALFRAAEREPVPATSKLDVARRLGLAVPELGGHRPAETTRARPAPGRLSTLRAARGVWSKLTFFAVVGGLGWGGSLLGAGHTGDGSAAPDTEANVATDRGTDSLSYLADDRTSTQGGAEKPISRRTSLPRNRRRTPSAPVVPHAAPSSVAPNRETPPPPLPANGGALLREVQSLDGARTALRAHDGARALALLDRYDSEFPRGELALESQVVRVAALVQTEQRAAARALALRTLAAPGSARYRTELEHSLRVLARAASAE